MYFYENIFSFSYNAVCLSYLSLESAKVSGGLNLLLLDSVLDGLLVNQLLELLLLSNQKMVLMGISLSRDSVQS